MDIAYRIIPPQGEETVGVIPLAEVAGLDKLKAFVLPHLRAGRPLANLEHVAVFYMARRASMFVDENGATDGLPVNEAATAVYHAASVARGETVDQPTPWPKSHGVAVLFDRNLWQ